MADVDWRAYAEQYDLMAKLNPAYQELVDFIAEKFKEFNLRPNSKIADFGSGTGNFSIAVAKVVPNSDILAIDFDQKSLEYLESKARSEGVYNIATKLHDLSKPISDVNYFDAALMVHFLYVMGKDIAPKILKNVFNSLKPGSPFLISDIGREIKVRDWAIYMAYNLVKKKGVKETIKMFKATSEVRRQNRNIQKCQKRGEYYLHTIPEFSALIESVGFKIKYASDEFYRGIDDLVIAYKP